jgi:hypothetical protein
VKTGDEGEICMMKFAFTVLAMSSVGSGALLAQANTYPFPASGSAGIGTTNPSRQLDVVGTFGASNATAAKARRR